MLTIRRFCGDAGRTGESCTSSTVADVNMQVTRVLAGR